MSLSQVHPYYYHEIVMRTLDITIDAINILNDSVGMNIAEARPRTAFAAWCEQVGLTRREVAAALGIRRR